MSTLLSYESSKGADVHHVHEAPRSYPLSVFISHSLPLSLMGIQSIVKIPNHLQMIYYRFSLSYVYNKLNIILNYPLFPDILFL